ncbi:protein tweety homolog 2-like [Babylonia areolata]|uniref:protein tweety homolog 2-like n=1 Tax=Babylonia areolata TaxID=304850 RepID=UPI003FD0CDD3
MSFMAHTGNAEYQSSWLAQFFHSFPHLDLSFEQTSANFTPQSGKYREALGFWAGIPLIWCCLLWLAFLIFFCARCCSKSQIKQSCSTCSTLWTGLFLLIGCGSLVVAFYGNAEVHSGVGDFVDAVNSANQTIERSLGVINIFGRITDDVENKGLPALTKAIDGITNITVHTKISELIKQILTNVNSAAAVTKSLRGDAERVNTEKVTDTTEYVEYYRWMGTILANCVYIVIFFLTFTALIKKSKWMLKLIAALSVLFMLVMWAMTSLYLFFGIGGGDLCVDPDSFVVSQVNGTVKEGEEC